MKTQFDSAPHKGFTLLELMVAMSITTLIVGVLVSVTAVALDTWNGSRAELRASRQGKAFIDTVAHDFESMIIRKGGETEWFSAIVPGSLPGTNLVSTNACDLIFFTAASDRYDGEVAGKDGVMGNTDDPAGGDISCVGYSLQYNAPIPGATGDFETFVLNRYLVNPDVTFTDLLGKNDLKTAFSRFEIELNKPESFICENIYQFTIVFHIQVAQQGTGGVATYLDVPVTLGNGSGKGITNSLQINGSRIESNLSGSPVTASELAAGKVTSVEISATVISDYGINQLRTRKFTGVQQSEFVIKNSYQFSKIIQIPSL